MSRHDPIAYTYEADTHCPECAEARFGADDDGFIAVDCYDREGNRVGAVFSWDEWWEPSEEGPQNLSCGDCGAILGTVDANDYGGEWGDEE